MQSLVRVALLERLSGTVSRHVVEDPGAVMRSVLLNLRRVLNSREGAAGANLEFGLPSPHELLLNWPGSQAQALAAVRRCLQRYEPRLTEIVVRPVPYTPGDTAISFQISARLIGPTRTPISLTTALSADGRVNLQ
jgi:type VI secretion system protein